MRHGQVAVRYSLGAAYICIFWDDPPSRDGGLSQEGCSHFVVWSFLWLKGFNYYVDLSSWLLLTIQSTWAKVEWKTMVRLTGLYRCTNQLSVRYVPSCTELYRAYQHMVHGGHTNVRPILVSCRTGMYRPYRVVRYGMANFVENNCLNDQTKLEIEIIQVHVMMESSSWKTSSGASWLVTRGIIITLSHWWICGSLRTSAKQLFVESCCWTIVKLPCQMINGWNIILLHSRLLSQLPNGWSGDRLLLQLPNGCDWGRWKVEVSFSSILFHSSQKIMTDEPWGHRRWHTAPLILWNMLFSYSLYLEEN